MLPDSVDSNLTYVGTAAAGASESQAVWKIMRMDETSGLVIMWAGGEDKVDNIWDNRESLSYS